MSEERIEFRVMVGWPNYVVPEVGWLIEGDDAPLASESDDVNVTEHAARYEADHLTGYYGAAYSKVQNRRVTIGDWEDV